MEMNIEWSELAEHQLKQIFDYYTSQVSTTSAIKIVENVLGKVSLLQNKPLLGAKEELLKEYPEEFRFLIARNYKIIYWKSADTITIASVFDCRQNPVKMKKIK